MSRLSTSCGQIPQQGDAHSCGKSKTLSRLPGFDRPAENGDSERRERGGNASREMKHLDNLHVGGTNGKRKAIPLLGEIQGSFRYL